ncbi:MAG: hypothetical protein PHV57_00795 [Methanomicrobiaceae archaeon]|nr:hypothetical protein [Methanomicrobiaceae archaeon]
MADFVEISNNRTAVRELAAAIPDISTFNSIVQDVIENNPFGCEDYVERGVAYDGVIRNRESYTVRVNYEDGNAKTIGTISARAPSVAAFNSLAAQLEADEDLEAIMGGDAVRDADRDTFSCQLKCRDPNGETYYVTLSRKAARLTSYEDPAIRNKVELWADDISVLD